jgi:hypothetical protein
MNTTCLIPQHRRERGEIAALQSSTLMKRQGRNFKALFCRQFHCSQEEYEQQLFRRTLNRHAFPFASVLAKVDPDFFREDRDLIRDMATAASHREVVAELNRFFGRNLRDRNWLRKWFSLRISGKRVLRLSRKVFRARD